MLWWHKSFSCEKKGVKWVKWCFLWKNRKFKINQSTERYICWEKMAEQRRPVSPGNTSDLISRFNNLGSGMSSVKKTFNNQFRFWAAHKANLVQCQGFFWTSVNSDMLPQTKWSTKEKTPFSGIVLYAITVVWSVSIRVLPLETFLMTFFSKLFHQPMRGFYLMVVNTSSQNKTNPTTSWVINKNWARRW